MKQKLLILLQAAMVGTASAVVLCLFKFISKYVIAFGKNCYEWIRIHPLGIVLAVAVVLGAALLYAFVYRRLPEIKGGGIPFSICAIRGLTKIGGWKHLFGIFALSLSSFFLGVPLGNEGPSVQMGTTTGNIISRFFGHREKKHALTGGACAGFSVATGAPISGILFSLEEAHGKINDILFAAAGVSVLFASIVNEILAPLLQVSKGLFDPVVFPALHLSNLWLPIVVGVVMGLFSIVFLKYYELIKVFLGESCARLPLWVKLFSVFLLTLAGGIFSFDFISTGHDLFHHLSASHTALWMLILILLVRTTLTLGANASGVTGGIFLPLLAIGGTVGAVIGNVAVYLGMSESLLPLTVMLGVVGCLAGMMRMPLTAVVFAIEALSLQQNVLFVVLTAVITFIITALARVESITEIIISEREKSAHLS